MPTPTNVTYFRAPADLRKWFRANHAKADEIWIGFHKRDSGTPSITWPESVDEALCVGWIDGIRKRIDEARYTIRFTRRQEPYAGLLKKNTAASTFFEAQPPSYRKVVGWWIVSAKKEETRLQRLQKLTDACARGKRLL